MNRLVSQNHKTFSIARLSSGIRLVTSRMPHTRSISVCIFVRVGSRDEVVEQSGISHFLEHMVFKGTEKRPHPKDISGPIESVGGILNAETTQEYTCYWCKVPESYLEESLDLLADMLGGSIMAPEEIERERDVVIEELGMISDQPDYRVDVLSNQMVWRNHPLAREVGGTKETIAAITRDQILNYMSTRYVASNIVVSVSGNVVHARVVELAEKLFARWRRGKPARPVEFSDIQCEPQIRVEYRKTEQAHLALALHGLPIEHPDRYAFDLFNVALGEGMSSRLFLELREHLGLAYDVRSSSIHFQDCGLFLINAGVQPKKLTEVVSALTTQVVKAREEMTEEELDKARQLTAGRMMLRMEDTRAMAYWFGVQEVLLNKVKEADEVVNDMRLVTIEDVHRISCELLQTKRLNLAVVGPIRGSHQLRRALSL